MHKPILSAIFALGLATTTQASTIDVSFSFQNIFNGGGLVTGIARGLNDNATGAATSVEVLSNDLGFGLGEYTGAELVNSWTLVSGVLTNANFTSFGSFNTAPAVTDASLSIFRGQGGLGLGDGVGSGVGSEVTFAVLSSTDPDPTPVPLPASGLMLLAGMLGLMHLRHRKTTTT